MKNSNQTRAGLVAAAVICGALALSGCGAGAGAPDSASDGRSISKDIAIQEAPAFEGATESMDAAVDPVPISGTSVITSGNATIKTNSPDTTAADFASKVTELGGEVVNTSQSEWDGSISASVDAKVPADRYQELVAALPGFGRILDQSTSKQDVGLQITDLTARKEALETSITRLQELMEQATTTEDLLQAENMLTQRQAELDSLNSQLTWLNDQVDMSSLYVTFSQDSRTGSGFSWGHAWDLFVGSIRAVAYAFFVALPWAALLGVILAAGLAIRRRRHSRTTATAKSSISEKSDQPANEQNTTPVRKSKPRAKPKQ